jgi:hypothetical protein
LIGIAQEKGDLNINLKTSDYLGKGWTSLPPEKEDLITVRHQLTMTSGLNELAFFCVEPGCLIYKADAGTRWAYHNGPYDLLKDVLESASQQNINVFTTLQLKIKIGMSSGIWIQVPPNHYFLSTARDMARFGLLMQNKMVWNGNPVLRDTAYYNAMISSSQELNRWIFVVAERQTISYKPSSHHQYRDPFLPMPLKISLLPEVPWGNLSVSPEIQV